MIKPDGVRRGLIGRVLTRFEEKGFKFIRLELLTMSRELAEEFYSVHKGKPFFERLISFITSGPVLAAIIEGPSAIEVVRKMSGATNSIEAEPGTVRGDFALGLVDNVIHASDSYESLLREAPVVFKDFVEGR